MTWADMSEGAIRVVQQKTGRKLTIPLHRNLLEVLAVAERDHLRVGFETHACLAMRRESSITEAA